MVSEMPLNPRNNSLRLKLVFWRIFYLFFLEVMPA
jgi:hypothetical protein